MENKPIVQLVIAAYKAGYESGLEDGINFQIDMEMIKKKEQENG